VPKCRRRRSVGGPWRNESYDCGRGSQAGAELRDVLGGCGFVYRKTCLDDEELYLFYMSEESEEFQ
jgi:hypothetical protein